MQQSEPSQELNLGQKSKSTLSNREAIFTFSCFQRIRVYNGLYELKYIMLDVVVDVQYSAKIDCLKYSVHQSQLEKSTRPEGTYVSAIYNVLAALYVFDRTIEILILRIYIEIRAEEVREETSYYYYFF